MSLNASTHSVIINSLSPGSSYLARVAPFTIGGIGPYSPSAYLHLDTSINHNIPRTDPAMDSFPFSWVFGIFFGLFGFVVLCVTISIITWAKKNNIDMKSSYSAHYASSYKVENNHTIWLKNLTTEEKPNYAFNVTHPLSEADYDEVSSIKISKLPEGTSSSLLQPYLENNSETIFVECFAQEHHKTYYDSNQKLNISYIGNNVLVRKKGDVSSPPHFADSFFSLQKTKNCNITIRTNPTALSPCQVQRQIFHFGADWVDSQLPPPIPDFPHNWIQERRSTLERVDPLWYLQKQDTINVSNTTSSIPTNKSLSENKDTTFHDEYEVGSVSYEQPFRRNETEFFSNIGEPTEKYYRNVNMEFNDDLESGSSTPSLSDSTSNKHFLNLNIVSSKSSMEISNNSAQQLINRNCEVFHKNYSSKKQDIVLINKHRNKLYEITCSSDEYETEQKNLKHRPRRIRSKIHEKLLLKKS